MRLLIIGFDGLDYYLTRDFLKRNPWTFTLKKLKAKIPATGPAWASIYTGADVKTHGITDIWGRPIEGSRSFEDIMGFTFWQIIRNNGFSVYTDNLPLTPAGIPFANDKRKDLVFWVEGDKKETFFNIIKNRPFRLVFEQVKKNNQKLIEDYLKKNVDLMFVQFSFVDRLFHTFRIYGEDLERIYTHCFEIAEKMYSELEPEHLLIVSDHGFCTKNNYHFNRIDGCCLFNRAAFDFFEKQGIFPKESFLREFTYDLFFSSNRFVGEDDRFLLRLYYLAKLLKTGRIPPALEWLYNHLICFARRKKSKEFKVPKEIVGSFLEFKYNFSYGLPQTSLFKALLALFGVKDFPEIGKKKKAKSRPKICDKALKLAEERMHALGYF